MQEALNGISSDSGIFARTVRRPTMSLRKSSRAHTGSREDPAANALAFVQQPEEDVLWLEGARPELADFGASVEKDLMRS